MGDTFYGANGKTFDRNVSAGIFLAKITVGLFQNIGCYPKTILDCKIIARILENRAYLNQFYNCHFKVYDLEEMKSEEVLFCLELAEFFKTCGGCLDEEEWYERFGNKEGI